MKKTLLSVVLLLAVLAGRADEGIWLPSLIGQRVKDMRSKGFRLTAADLYDLNRASMKDAIVHFGGGCTGEIISAEGLLLTNHHCGYGQIQKHSSIEHDYLTNGFWAMSRTEELPNPGLTATLLVRMEDVTARMMQGIDEGMDPKERAGRLKANSKAIRDEATRGTHYTAAVESCYYNNQYFLYVNEVFEDVRLVGAPPSSIGKFGGDTDNWMWPRHTGDFSLFRIYAGPDNKPAKYSRENVPYKPKYHFKISTKGVSEGDFTFIYGFPGRTSEYLLSDAVDYIASKSDPAKIALRTMRLDQIKAASEADPRVRIQYAAKAAGVANSWKKWQGEALGLQRLGTADRKRADEVQFEQWAAALPADHPRKAQYIALIPEMRELYARLEPFALARDYYNEAIGGIELAKLAGSLSAAKSYDKARQTAETFYKDYDQQIDRRTSLQLLQAYMQNVPSRFIPQAALDGMQRIGLERGVGLIFDRSALSSREAFMALDSIGLMDICKGKSPDTAMELYKGFRTVYDSLIAPRYSAINDSITALYTLYMRGLMEREPRRAFYPDANSTLRVAYGHVAGYRAADGVKHDYRTTLDGIIAKDDPAVYDYNIPQRLRELYAAKDYGRWAVDGTVPVAFLATNHTSGGNSGSPLLNGRGELIGLNFDRTWLSTMSDIQFDPAICRNISVDVRYVMFVVEKVGGAGYLFDEMDFVN